MSVLENTRNDSKRSSKFTDILTKEPSWSNIFQQGFGTDIKPEFRTTTYVHDTWNKKYSQRTSLNPFFTVKLLSASPIKWSNTLKQFVGKSRQIV